MSKLYERVRIGQPPSFNSPEEMWVLAVDYFKWCEDNAIEESKVFNNQGEVLNAKVPHMRAMTQAGLCAFLNVSKSTWHNYKNKEDYLDVTSTIDQIMFEQKFSGAAAGMLNANIIARDLGLADKTETDATVNVRATIDDFYATNS